MESVVQLSSYWVEGLNGDFILVNRAHFQHEFFSHCKEKENCQIIQRTLKGIGTSLQHGWKVECCVPSTPSHETPIQSGHQRLIA